VKVTNGGASDTETLTLSVVQRLKISPLKVAAEVGASTQITPKATGGKPGYSWSLAAGAALPAGLGIDRTTGAITGSPTTAGKTTVKLVVTDTLGLTDSLDVQLNVAPKLLITRKPLSAAKVGSAYDTFFKARGGVAPRRWFMLRSVAPAGLRLNAKTGELSGIPRKAGTYRLQMQVRDKLGVRSLASFVLKVAA
jgi:hypothetical protein